MTVDFELREEPCDLCGCTDFLPCFNDDSPDLSSRCQGCGKIYASKSK